MTAELESNLRDAVVDRWDEFLKFLQFEVWLDYELVTEKLQEAIDRNRREEYVVDDDAFNLARLRLALIQAQVQAAPAWYVEYNGTDTHTLRAAAKYTERFFQNIKPRQTKITPDDLIRIPDGDLPVMKELAHQLATDSWRGQTPIMVQHRRTAQQHRQPFLTGRNPFKSAELLAAVNSSAGSFPLRPEELLSSYGAAVALEGIRT